MEEQILQIITKIKDSGKVKHLSSVQVKQRIDAAKEITSMIKEFMKWWIFSQHPFIAWVDEDGEFITDEIGPKKWTIEEIFDHWFKNIRNK